MTVVVGRRSILRGFVNSGFTVITCWKEIVAYLTNKPDNWTRSWQVLRKCLWLLIRRTPCRSETCPPTDRPCHQEAPLVYRPKDKITFLIQWSKDDLIFGLKGYGKILIDILLCCGITVPSFEMGIREGSWSCRRKRLARWKEDLPAERSNRWHLSARDENWKTFLRYLDILLFGTNELQCSAKARIFSLQFASTISS